MPAIAEQVRKQSKLATIGWALLIFLAIGTGAGALRYALPKVPYPAPLPNFSERHHWLIAHAVCSAIALLIGPWQFFANLRRRWLAWHRWLGRIYCLAVAVGWIASLPIASHAQTGLAASAGFLSLGAFWIATTALGYFQARSGLIRVHRVWMLRSYALTFAAVTLRIYLPLLLIGGVRYTIAYPLVAWLCWVPNLAIVEWWRRAPGPG